MMMSVAMLDYVELQPHFFKLSVLIPPHCSQGIPTGCSKFLSSVKKPQ